MKKYLYFFAATCCLLSCTTTNKEENSQKIDNEKLIRKLYETFNAHKWEEMANLYAETAEFKDPSFGTEIVKQTKAQLVKKYAELGHMIPDIRDEVVNLYHTDDHKVVVEFVATGTGPDGKQFKMPICTIFTIENGKITKDFTYYDNF